MCVAFVTFGCRLNKAEALDLEARYAAAGWEVVSIRQRHDDRPVAANQPDLIVVRGCSVTAKAQHDCEKAIAQLKVRFPAARIRITGCLAKAQAVSGADRSPADGADTANAPEAGEPVGDKVAPAERYRLSRAYLKVQDGCSGKCAFCIVPSFRGQPRSIPFQTAVERARAFLAAGFREIVLTGCNLCLYRSEGRGIAELAAALASLESPGHRIRFGSIEPGMCDSRIIDAMESHPNVCRFIHLSLQSGSDRVLRMMRRPYTASQVADLCADAVRRLGPRLALGADLIAGFPGETAADHEDTKRIILETYGDANIMDGGAAASRLSPFIHLHVFPFSERPGTEAAAMPHPVPIDVRHVRAREIERIGAANRAAFAASMVGREVSVCVERDGNGRTDEYLRCLLSGSAPRRSLALAKVTGFSANDGSVKADISAAGAR